MLVRIALAVAALLGQVPPEPGAPAAAPSSPGETAPPAQAPAEQVAPTDPSRAVLPPSDTPAEPSAPPDDAAAEVPPPPDRSREDGELELGILYAPRADDGDLDGLLTAGIDWAPWHLGAARAGFRLGAMLGGIHGACPEDVECSYAGFYAGPLIRIAPLHARSVSPWVEVAVTPFLATGLNFEEATLAAIELPRISAGLDVIAGPVRIGVSAFHSRVPFDADASHGAVVMWGSTLRFAFVR